MSIFKIAAIIGLLLPVICLIITWKDLSVRKYISIYLLLQLLQIATEKTLASYSLRHLIKYTALIFVLSRLYQLWLGRKNLRPAIARYHLILRAFLIASYSANWGLWIYVAFRLCRRIATEIGWV